MESKIQQSDLDLPGNFDYNSEWPMLDYDDGPVTIDDYIVEYKTFEQVSWWRLKQMLERWPAMRKSWEAFIIDYNVCLATLRSEETDDDIPF
jgi:hypothetical protein